MDSTPAPPADSPDWLRFRRDRSFKFSSPVARKRDRTLHGLGISTRRKEGIQAANVRLFVEVKVSYSAALSDLEGLGLGGAATLAGWPTRPISTTLATIATIHIKVS